MELGLDVDETNSRNLSFNSNRKHRFGTKHRYIFGQVWSSVIHFKPSIAKRGGSEPSQIITKTYLYNYDPFVH